MLEFLFKKEKRNSKTGVFLWNLQNFKNTFYYRTPLVSASDTAKHPWWRFQLLIIFTKSSNITVWKGPKLNLISYLYDFNFSLSIIFLYHKSFEYMDRFSHLLQTFQPLWCISSPCCAGINVLHITYWKKNCILIKAFFNLLRRTTTEFAKLCALVLAPSLLLYLHVLITRFTRLNYAPYTPRALYSMD